jgi:hypothetical protein
MTTATTRHHLHLLRDHLGDLHAARHTDPSPVWPPQRLTTEMWAIRDAEAAAERAERNADALGDAPAPVVNLAALEAYQDIEDALGQLADVVAAACQRPAYTLPVPTSDPRRSAPWIPNPVDAQDPRRWHINRATTNAHWAAVYVDGRLAGDDLGGVDDLFTTLPVRLEDEIASVVRELWRRMATVLGIGDRTDTLPRPCPWCKGKLRLRQPPGEAPYVTCRTGWDCSAPHRRDARGRPLWIGGEMVHLHTALEKRELGAVIGS